MITKEAANLLTALEVVRETSEQLLPDVARCHDALKPIVESYPNPTPAQREEVQFWLRMYTHAVFALVEGVSYVIRQSAIALHKEGQLPLSPGEWFVLLEKRYSLRNGKLRDSDAFNGVLDNLHLAFGLFPRAFGVGFNLDTGDHRYRAFRQAIELRNLITHPKHPEDLKLSSEAISSLGVGVKWFSSEGVRMLKACVDTIDSLTLREWTKMRLTAPSSTALADQKAPLSGR